MVGLPRRRPAGWGNASARLGLEAGEDQHLPRGARSPLSGTFQDVFLTRAKGIGFLLPYKWPNILLRLVQSQTDRYLYSFMQHLL